MTTTRENRTTCRYCRASLDNGQPLTTELVEVTEVWSRNSVGFVRRPVSPHMVPSAAHADCALRARVEHIESQRRYWADMIVEFIEEGASAKAIARAQARLAEVEAELAEVTS